MNSCRLLYFTWTSCWVDLSASSANAGNVPLTDFNTPIILSSKQKAYCQQRIHHHRNDSHHLILDGCPPPHEFRLIPIGQNNRSLQGQTVMVIYHYVSVFMRIHTDCRHLQTHIRYGIVIIVDAKRNNGNGKALEILLILFGNIVGFASIIISMRLSYQTASRWRHIPFLD